MEKQIYLNLLIVCAILAQEIGALSDDNTKPHIRKKRLIDRTRGGNRAVRIQEAPHVVSVHLDNNHTCTGTILYDNVILVTAECVHEDEPGTYSVVSGTNRRDEGQRHTVLRISYHPLYRRTGGEKGDLALLEITPHIDLVHSINRKLVIYSGNLSPNTLCRTSGWGANRLDRRVLGHAHPILLRSITVRTINLDDCKRLNDDDPDVHEGVICTYDTTLQQHASDGDASNPLYDMENRYLYGIMIWSRGHGKPDVYLDLNYPEYKAWIVPEIVRIASNRPVSVVRNIPAGRHVPLERHFPLIRHHPVAPRSH